MCGIVGIISPSDVTSNIMDALERLEYRGYDSAGLATINSGKIEVRRAAGKLENLKKVIKSEPIKGKIGIGHTRWATHGAPTKINAHPHQAGSVVVVHNGIIENHKELKFELSQNGIQFASETDTEVIVKLCEHFVEKGQSSLEAVRATIGRLKGAFALCFIIEGDDSRIYAARRGSPLAVGYGNGEMYVGSDAVSLAKLTKKICYLEEDDEVILTSTNAQFFNQNGNQVVREIKLLGTDEAESEKGNYPHFMLKEIHQQPEVLGYALGASLNSESNEVDLKIGSLDFNEADRIVLVACGTAYYACMVAKYWFEEISRIRVEVDVASEFRYREPPMSGKEYAILVSQSGETADTLAALRYLKNKVKKIIAIVNVSESSIAREADSVLLIKAGPEIGVASTKAFTCQMMVLASLSLSAGRQVGKLTNKKQEEFLSALGSVPRLVSEVLRNTNSIKNLGENISTANSALFLGRGSLYPLALEGALKLKEISYIHAEGYPSGELKHGPIALVEPKMPIICLISSNLLFDKSSSNIEEVLTRGGKVVAISDEKGCKKMSDKVWCKLVMPDCHPLVEPIIYAIPIQMIAYYTADFMGLDVDQPRNLAKSVTVE